MEPLTADEIQRYADEYNLPPLPPGPDPNPEAMARAMQVARDAFTATVRREHVRDGSCCRLPAGDI
jgi:hypothetical protein